MRTLRLAATLALLATALLAADHPATLQPLDWLTGGTWTADIPEPKGTATTHIETRIQWSPNGQAVEFVTSFNGHPHYNGVYLYDPAAKTIRFYYSSSDGDLTTGTCTPTPTGLTQEFDITNPDGTTNHLRSQIRQTTPDDYDWQVEGKKDGDWKVLIKLHYVRKKV